MDDETREKIREAVSGKIGTAFVKDIDGGPRRVATPLSIENAIVAGVEAALDAYGEREPSPDPNATNAATKAHALNESIKSALGIREGPDWAKPPSTHQVYKALNVVWQSAVREAKEERERKPAPDSGGEVELPWESTPDEQADHVRVDEGFGGGADGTYVEVCAGAGAANVTPSEIPHMARALFQAAGLEWPGDEDAERLKREANQLQVQLAGCAVAAEGGTSPEHVAERGDYGWSASYQAVLDCRRELDQLRDNLHKAADALGCDLDEVPERVRKELRDAEKARDGAWSDMRAAIDRKEEARKEMHQALARAENAERERDEARADAERWRECAENWQDQHHRLRDRLSEAATALGCDLYEVPDRVREAKACEKEFLSLAQDRYHRLVALKNERDEARAEVERIRKDMQALWHQTRDDDQLVTRLRSELRQARFAAPETVRVLRLAFECKTGRAHPSLLYQAVAYWVDAGRPNYPKGGDDDR